MADNRKTIRWYNNDMGLPVHRLPVTDNCELCLYPHEDMYRCELHSINEYKWATTVREWELERSLELEEAQEQAVSMAMAWLREQLAFAAGSLCALTTIEKPEKKGA